MYTGRRITGCPWWWRPPPWRITGLSELNRFAPDLSVMVLNGSSAQRASQIRHVKEVGDVEVLITSYPLIRRDIDQLTDIPFRLVILDEAQHIKNAGSVGAVSVKQLQARTRFALTGTPMENSAGELWSLFDFVLPGYLNTYSAFLRRYQDGQDAEDLRRRIRPFLMRRLKKDVLTELPDKLETVLTAQMTPEQQRVYQAAMIRLPGARGPCYGGKGTGARTHGSAGGHYRATADLLPSGAGAARLLRRLWQIGAAAGDPARGHGCRPPGVIVFPVYFHAQNSQTTAGGSGLFLHVSGWGNPGQPPHGDDGGV